MSNGVYCLTFPNGKRYVGRGYSSPTSKGRGRRGIEKRWNDYARLDCKKQPKLYNAIIKYGWENVKKEVILLTDDVERQYAVEKQLIALWNLQSHKYGYNISPGGRDGFQSDRHPNKGKKGKDAFGYGNKHSQEARTKQSETRKRLYREGKLLITNTFEKGVSPWNKGKSTIGIGAVGNNGFNKVILKVSFNNEIFEGTPREIQQKFLPNAPKKCIDKLSRMGRKTKVNKKWKNKDGSITEKQYLTDGRKSYKGIILIERKEEPTNE
jgi:hypothetical protein